MDTGQLEEAEEDESVKGGGLVERKQDKSKEKLQKKMKMKNEEGRERVTEEGV